MGIRARILDSMNARFGLGALGESAVVVAVIELKFGLVDSMSQRNGHVLIGVYTSREEPETCPCPERFNGIVRN